LGTLTPEYTDKTGQKTTKNLGEEKNRKSKGRREAKDRKGRTTSLNRQEFTANFGGLGEERGGGKKS